MRAMPRPRARRTAVAVLLVAALPATAAAQDVSIRDSVVQHFRPYTQRGINVFEPPKFDSVAFDGPRLKIGAAFTQQFQGLSHENAADSVPISATNRTNANRLIEIGSGFNNAVANLYLDAQLARGIRVALTTYLSSRHHNETWVKDGYLLIDDVPFDAPALAALMRYVTVKAGHFEVNYGDAHFRRTDNGNAMYNPLVGNYILDAFTTEIGGEVYFRTPQGLIAMVGVTGGEIRGNLTRPGDRGPAFLGKLGFDRELAPNVRVRLTGSAYTLSKSPASTLYAGDRAGSRYYLVLENSVATEAAQFTSGAINPNFRREVTSFMINPFVKVGGLELFGVLEQSKGRGYQPAPNNLLPETADREVRHYVAEAVYRLAGDRVFVAGRYNRLTGELTGIENEVGVDRGQLGLGWFISPNILVKGEYVSQKYDDFPTRDIRSGGKFDGFMIEGVVAF